MLSSLPFSAPRYEMRVKLCNWVYDTDREAFRGRTMLSEIDVSRHDREIGSMLTGNDVETLRDAIRWSREHYGVRYREVAEGCATPEHTIRNFVTRKSVRPDNAVLGRLYVYLTANRHLLPEPPHDRVNRLTQTEMVRSVLPISDEDVKRVFDRYSGYYLCVRLSSRPSNIIVSWLHLMKENVPLPRFTHSTQYPDPVDRDPRNYIIIGYAICRNGRIYLTGHHDAELKHFILNEPLTRRFKYIEGLCLLTSSEDKEPFSTKIICRYLGTNASREDWKDRIGLFSFEEFKSLFDDADALIRSLGDGGVLTVADNA